MAREADRGQIHKSPWTPKDIGFHPRAMCVIKGLEAGERDLDFIKVILKLAESGI